LTVVAGLGLSLLLSTPIHAERHRSVAPPIQPLTIEFVSVPEPEGALIAAGSDAWIDVRTVSQQKAWKGKAVRVRRRFGMRVHGGAASSWATATITARLDSPDGRAVIRIDGQIVSGVPVVIASHAAIGATTIHTLEIEVSDAVPEGPIAASISWEATTQ
jgi:hypothetical protein